MSTNAAIYPGQGAQLVGMGKDFADQYAVAADTFAKADEILAIELSRLCFEGPAEKLNATDIQQPAIFTTSVALFRAAVDAGVLRLEQFAAMGGLSLGEYTALHLAGVLSFEDALRLVHRRGRLMQEACDQFPGGMVSIMGADEDKVLALCERVSLLGKVKPANFNCPGQIVISGDKAACEEAAKLAEQFDTKAVPLPVAGAFHSDLMRSAADGLKPHLEDCEFRKPLCRVIANVDADYHADPRQMRDSLYRQIFNPVRWQACVERLIADGCDLFWEVGPNRVLTGLMRKIDRTARTINISSVERLAEAKE